MSVQEAIAKRKQIEKERIEDRVQEILFDETSYWHENNPEHSLRRRIQQHKEEQENQNQNTDKFVWEDKDGELHLSPELKQAGGALIVLICLVYLYYPY